MGDPQVLRSFQERACVPKPSRTATMQKLSRCHAAGAWDHPNCANARVTQRAFQRAAWREEAVSSSAAMR